jgi:ankyrin repeat protein
MTPLMRFSQDLIVLDPEGKPRDCEYLLPTMKCLLEHKADVDLIHLNHRTALHHLCYNGVTSASFDFIRLLVSSGALLCAKDVDGVTPFEVLFAGCVEPGRRTKYFTQSDGFDPSNVLQFIIDNAPDNLNDPLRPGIPPLSFALEWRHNTAVDLLLSKEEVSVDIRKTGKDIRTAIETAAYAGCTVSTARALLSRTNKSVYGFDPAHGNTLLHFAACDISDQTVLKQLLQGDINIEVLNRAAETPLHTAVSEGNCKAVRLLLEAGANTANASGATAILPLHLAAQAGRLPIVQTLIEFGADVNASSKDTKSTALHYASRNGSWDLVSFLIRRGALIDERDVDGATPYVVAARANHWHIVRKFTKLADLSVPDFEGLGGLHYAILAGSISLVRFLKKHCPALPQNIKDREGKILGNELTCTIRSGNIDLFQMFWEDKSKNFISEDGYGLSHFAVAASTNDVRNLLLPHITEWNLSTANMRYSNGHVGRRWHSLKGLQPFHIAVFYGNHTAVTFLREKDLLSDINALTTGEEAYSSVHLAAISNRPGTVKLLANIGADLNLKDKAGGQTPLHVAARLGFADIVTALLDAGCMPNLMDDYGMTPELLAIEHEHHAVAKILGQHLDSLKSNIDLREDNNPSTSVLDTHGKPWKLPLAPSPHMSKVMTSNVSIYAVHDTECPEALYKALEECNNHGVYNLKKPFKRLV